MQEKRIFWQYEIEGERDIVTEVEKMILETADEYKQQAETTNKAIRTVRLTIFIEYHLCGLVGCIFLYWVGLAYFSVFHILCRN